ncbi:5-oxoprolinase subunit PxpB [Gluconobacter cerinus]|uniref:5-oxoprolinase subunit PxpB n=1 Tax=Gluconobacter cerinus TaxID=38307 RepID=UPI0039E88A2C
MSIMIKTKAPIHISMIGIFSILVQADGDISLDIQRRIWALGRTIQTWNGVQEVVYGVTNLMVVCDHYIPAPEVIMQKIQIGWEHAEAKIEPARIIEIDAVYGGEDALDIDAVCMKTGLSVLEIAKIHSAPVYDVFAVGSAPGFGYFAGLDTRLFMGRKETPALRVEKGALIIGGMQTAISSQTGPNGWNVIGKCDVDLFDISKENPCLLTPGDKIKFSVSNIIQ